MLSKFSDLMVDLETILTKKNAEVFEELIVANGCEGPQMVFEWKISETVIYWVVSC